MPKDPKHREAFNAKRREKRRLARLEGEEKERVANAERKARKRRQAKLEKEAEATRVRERDRKYQAKFRAKKKKMSTQNAGPDDNAGLSAEMQALLAAEKQAEEDDREANKVDEDRLFTYFKERDARQQGAREKKFAPLKTLITNRANAETEKIAVDNEIKRSKDRRMNEQHEMRKAQSARKAAESAAKVKYWNEKAKTERKKARSAHKMRSASALAETQRQPFVGMSMNNEVRSPEVSNDDNDSPVSQVRSPEFGTPEEIPNDGNHSPVPVIPLPAKTPSNRGLFGSLRSILSGNGSKNPIELEDSPPQVDSPVSEGIDSPVLESKRRNKVAFVIHSFDPDKIIRPDESGKMVIYNQAVLDEWNAYSDQEIVKNFTEYRLKHLFEESEDGHLKVRQVLYVVHNKGFLRRRQLNGAAMRYANGVAFPEANMGWGRHFTGFSPARRQIMSRLEKDLSVRIRLFEEDLANQASNDESDEGSSDYEAEHVSDEGSSDDAASKMEA